MKRTLALLAAAVMVAAPLAIAKAEDAPAAAPAAAAAEAGMQELTLKDGTKVVVKSEDQTAWVVGADGAKTAAPDGEHELADGTKITVAGGKVTAGLPAAK